MSIFRPAATILPLLLLTSLAAAADPSIAIRRVMESDYYNPPQMKWTSPSTVDARLRPRGPFVSVGEYLANYRGREMEMRELSLGYGITDAISVWFANQDYLIKGRSATSRFDLKADTYGVRWVVMRPVEDHDPSLAIRVEAVRPGTATARSGNSMAKFFATKNYTVAVDYGFGSGLQTELSYSNVKGAATGNADIFGLAAGKDLDLSSRLQLRLQGHLVGQSYTDVVEHVSFEVKPVLFAALGYDVTRSVRLEGDATFMPFGMPLSSGRFTALSSFQIYRPGGVAEGLRKDAIGFASLRLVFHGSL